MPLSGCGSSQVPSSLLTSSFGQQPSKRELANISHPSPSQNPILLGALTFLKIEIFVIISYTLNIRFANSELVATKEKLEIVSRKR